IVSFRQENMNMLAGSPDNLGLIDKIILLQVRLQPFRTIVQDRKPPADHLQLSRKPPPRPIELMRERNSGSMSIKDNAILLADGFWSIPLKSLVICSPAT